MGVKNVTDGRTDQPTDEQGVSRSRILLNYTLNLFFKSYFNLILQFISTTNDASNYTSNFTECREIVFVDIKFIPKIQMIHRI